MTYTVSSGTLNSSIPYRIAAYARDSILPVLYCLRGDAFVSSYYRLRRRRHDIITGRMPRSGKLPVLNLLIGQKSGFSPRRGDSLHRFKSNLTGPTGTWVRLAVQNFASIAKWGWECGPQNIKNFHFLVKSRPVGRIH